MLVFSGVELYGAVWLQKFYMKASNGMTGMWQRNAIITVFDNEHANVYARNVT